MNQFQEKKKKQEMTSQKPSQNEEELSIMERAINQKQIETVDYNKNITTDSFFFFSIHKNETLDVSSEFRLR